MHQGVPADKCSCGLTRGKIRDWWTPESSQGGIDLLIPSLDKGCENNDALNAALAPILGNWAGEAMQGREFRSGLEVKKLICGLISLVWKRHQLDPTQPQEEALLILDTYVNLQLLYRTQAFINKQEINCKLTTFASTQKQLPRGVSADKNSERNEHLYLQNFRTLASPQLQP